MATVRFNLRDGRNKTDNRPVYLIVTDHGKPILKYPTGIKVSHNDWNEATYRIRKGNPNFDKHNQILTNLESKVTQIFADYAAINKTLTGEAIRNELDGLTNRGKTKNELYLCSYVENYNSKLLNEINPTTGRLLSRQTISKFNCLLKVIKEMQVLERKTFIFDDIDKSFYNRFLGLLQSKKFQPNTIGNKYVEPLKTILHEAESKGIQINSFLKDKKFIAPKAEPFNIYLNEVEIGRLQNLDLTDVPRLERVRDVFMIGCFTGQRWSDYSTLSKDNFQTDRIKILQEKTAKQVTIHLDEEVRIIMERYNWKLPKISNQKFNEYIKEVCKLAHIDEMISRTAQYGREKVTTKQPKYELVGTHTARRSYATNMYLRDKGAMISIMQTTGHTTQKMFLKYVCTTDEEHLSIMRDLQNGVAKVAPRLKVANS